MLLATLLIPACSGSTSGGSPANDAGTGSDSGSVDGSAADSGPAETGSQDAGPVDAGSPDSGPADSGVKPDSGSKVDSGVDAACVYPSGPYYGADGSAGMVLDPTLEWTVYAPGADAASTLKITDLWDCDGTKGINAIVIDNSAQWCVACQYEAGNVPGWMASTGPIAGNWSALGVQFLTLIIENNSYEPATIETADQWRTQFNLTGVYVAADPNIAFPTPSLPHNLLVDPRTMTVTDDLDNDTYDAAVPEDASTAEPPDPAVAQLATQNKK